MSSTQTLTFPPYQTVYRCLLTDPYLMGVKLEFGDTNTLSFFKTISIKVANTSISDKNLKSIVQDTLETKIRVHLKMPKPLPSCSIYTTKTPNFDNERKIKEQVDRLSLLVIVPLQTCAFRYGHSRQDQRN